MCIARYSLLAAALLAGCVQLPLTPEDLEARKFEAVPGKAVIYLVRDSMDFSERQAEVHIGDKLLLKTYPGTYFRWVVEPGAHRITGYAGDSGTLTVQAEPGRIYFVKQQLPPLMQMPSSRFFLVSDAEGRAAVLRAVLLETP